MRHMEFHIYSVFYFYLFLELIFIYFNFDYDFDTYYYLLLLYLCEQSSAAAGPMRRCRLDLDEGISASVDPTSEFHHSSLLLCSHLIVDIYIFFIKYTINTNLLIFS